MSILVI